MISQCLMSCWDLWWRPGDRWRWAWVRCYDPGGRGLAEGNVSGGFDWLIQLMVGRWFNKRISGHASRNARKHICLLFSPVALSVLISESHHGWCSVVEMCLLSPWRLAQRCLLRFHPRASTQEVHKPVPQPEWAWKGFSVVSGLRSCVSVHVGKYVPVRVRKLCVRLKALYFW